MFGRRGPTSRGEILARASKLVARRKLKKAALLFERLVREHPRDVDIHRKAALTFARLRRFDDAWASFSLVGESLAESGFEDKAVGLFHEAAHFMPQRVDVWLRIAELHLAQDRAADGRRVLLEGRSHMTSRRYRSEAVRLLSRAHQIDPLPVSATLDLARLLRKTGQRREAYVLLQETIPRAPARYRAALRRAQLAARPALATLWRALRGR